MNYLEFGNNRRHRGLEEIHISDWTIWQSERPPCVMLTIMMEANAAPVSDHGATIKCECEGSTSEQKEESRQSRKTFIRH